MSPQTMLVVISFYKYLMLILVSVFLFLIPIVEPHQYFNSPFEDILAKCVLWLYFIGSYFSTTTSIKNEITKGSRSFIMIRKDFISFVLLSISAIVTGAFMSFLTRWSLIAFTPQFPDGLTLILSLGNGVIYAIFILSQYYFLPAK
jgi:hypothetical protein